MKRKKLNKISGDDDIKENSSFDNFPVVNHVVLQAAVIVTILHLEKPTPYIIRNIFKSKLNNF